MEFANQIKELASIQAIATESDVEEFGVRMRKLAHFTTCMTGTAVGAAIKEDNAQIKIRLLEQTKTVISKYTSNRVERTLIGVVIALDEKA